MGYWKREYTERRGGRPLFQAESKRDDGEDASSERREQDRTDPPFSPGQPSSDTPAGGD